MFTFAHNNLNVFDLEKSLDFYKKALGLIEQRRIVPSDGSFIIVYLTDGKTPHLLELTWLRDRTEPYNLGDNEIHLAFTADDMIRLMPCIRRWDASVLKIPIWVFILSPIRMDIGWK